MITIYIVFIITAILILVFSILTIMEHIHLMNELKSIKCEDNFNDAFREQETFDNPFLPGGDGNALEKFTKNKSVIMIEYS